MKRFVWICLLFAVCFALAEVGGSWSGVKQVQLENKVKMIDISRNENHVAAHGLTKTKRKATRRERCCHLGRRLAKIGEKCQYSYSIASLQPNYEHYHKLKTKLWVTTEKPIIKARLLRKCKRYKVFYEKCCHYEARLIDQDLKRMIKRLKKFLRKLKQDRKLVKLEKRAPFVVQVDGKNTN